MAIFNIDYNALWDGICRWGSKAGRAAARPVLLLWFVMRDPATPWKDKLAIGASLAYLVLPIDLLDARRLPIIGWLDEALSVGILLQRMAKRITPEMQGQTDAVFDRWFPEYVKYEMIED